MADQSEIRRDRDCLRVVIDDGSGYLKVEAQHVRAGESARGVPTDTIQLQEGEDKIRQKFVIEDDKLHCGEIEVANWLLEHPTEANRVIELCKLAQCPEYAKAPATARFYEAIGAYCHGQTGDIHDFKLLVFKWIRDRICAWYRDLSPKGHNFPGQYWTDIQIEATITVPAMWDDHQCGVVRNAAREAGFLNLLLRLEPLCAAAREMRLLKERGYLKDHDTFLWHDIGHATIDFALVRIEEAAVTGDLPHLVVVGRPTGSLLGSHVIHDLAWKYVETCEEVMGHGGLSPCLKLLGSMSGAEFVRQFTERIEEEKRRSPCRPFTISINAMEGWRDIPGGIRFLDIRITKQEVESWLNEWTQKLVVAQTNYVETFGPNAVGGIVITGGGGSNKIAFAGLKTAASAMNIRLISADDRECNPVAKGGLSLYPVNEADSLPVGCWYAVRDEEFDYTRHSDAIKKIGKIPQWELRDGLMYPELEPELTRSNLIGDGFEAIDRIALIARTGENGATVETYCIPYSFPIEAEYNPRLEFEMYFSKKSELDGKPLRDRKGEMRPIFKRFQMQLADLAGVNWESFESALTYHECQGKKWLYLDGYIEMITTEDRWDLQVTILEPGEQLRFEDESEALSKGSKTSSKRQKRSAHLKFNATYPYKILYRTTRSVWDKFCSNTIRNVHVAAPDTMPEASARRAKPRSKEHVGIKHTMATRSHDIQTNSLTRSGPARSVDGDVANTTVASDVWATSLYASASTTNGKRAPSDRRGVKCENSSRKRVVDPRFESTVRDLAENTTPSPSTRQGVEASDGLSTPPSTIEIARQEERPQGSASYTSAQSRLAALQTRPHGMSAVEFFELDCRRVRASKSWPASA